VSSGTTNRASATGTVRLFPRKRPSEHPDPDHAQHHNSSGHLHYLPVDLERGDGMDLDHA